MCHPLFCEMFISQGHYWTFKSFGTLCWVSSSWHFEGSQCPPHTGTVNPMSPSHIWECWHKICLNDNLPYSSRPYELSKKLLFEHVFNPLTNNKMLLKQKHKHITLHSVYLQYLNMWQSPSKQHNSHLNVLDHKDKWMAGNELMWRLRLAVQSKYRSWEVRRKTHTLQLLFPHALTASDHL